MLKNIDLWTTRNRIIESKKKTPTEELSLYGKELMESERYPDALDFFAKAGDAASAGEVAKIAISLGNCFLLESARKAFGEKPSKEELEALAEAASARGLVLYETRARELAKTAK
ncbi:MAG: hypothetical protein LBF41_01335 [Deltaproteobacteria bacterium]|jgi:thioredoxin-like negative regulator of GroEL|nr:hypothetical protein [Deltaproteobacteria bacterium]